MKTSVLDCILRELLYFDGATGTVLQSLGLAPGEAPERWNLTHPGQVTALHRAYLEAGCSILKTNTFGINRDKFPDFRALIAAAVSCAKEAADGREDVYIAYDMGPSGRLIEPLGDLPFEEAVSLFAENVRAAVREGVDLILIETMNDSYETKAAVLAAKENSDLPVFVTNVYDERGRLMTGASPLAMIALLEGLGTDAIGINCSLGPDAMLPLVEEFRRFASVPIIVNPNAGLPEVQNGETRYTLDADSFAASMRRIAESGACLLGGCCGTTPDYLRKMIVATADVPYLLPEKKNDTLVSSYSDAVRIGDSPVLIGERINPTGKPRLKEALRSGDMAYLQNEALRQEEAGAHILDVNVGLPGLCEAELMPRAVKALQSVTALPLQIDSASPEAIGAAMRLYNGKPLVNSVNGDPDKMKAIFPLVKKYGGAVVALTMDESGIPDAAGKRVEIARRIAETAASFGIAPKDLIFDPLTLSVSADPDSAGVTLRAVRELHESGYRTVLGVSNVSFGLPAREKINMTFFAAALESGLSAAILNPFSVPMTDVYHAYRVLHGQDPACGDYIAYASRIPSPAVSLSALSAGAPVQDKSSGAPGDGETDLQQAICRGLKENAVREAALLLGTVPPLEIIRTRIIPALNRIGADFEAHRIYLPQLLMSAEAASAAFERIKEKLPPSEKKDGREIVLATVKGDIHDIGKNIVKVLLESYGFTVYDLGRDVPPETIRDCAVEKNCRLVGLSALMTTTVPAMEETIRLLHKTDAAFKVVVGGAVLTPEYAAQIGADCYAADAVDTVRYAEAFYAGTKDEREDV